MQSERARKTRFDADDKQLNMLARLGSTVPREEVLEAHEHMGRAVRDDLAARRLDLAERIARMDDPREIEALLAKSDTNLLTVLWARIEDGEKKAEIDVQAA